MYQRGYYGEYDEEPSTWPYYVAIVFVISIAYAALTGIIQSVFYRHSPDNRPLPAYQLWLSVVPFFGGLWIFYVVHQLAHSLSEEFKRRKLVEFETYPGLGVGWAFSFLALTAELTLLIDEPLICTLLFIAAAALLITYWIKLAGFKSKLEQEQFGYSLNQQPTPQMHGNYPPPPAPPLWSQQQQEFPYNPPVPPPEQQQNNDWDRWRPK